MLRLVDFSCMSITVLLQKTRASYVPWFNFNGIFSDKKSDFQIAIFKFFKILAKKSKFYSSLIEYPSMFCFPFSHDWYYEEDLLSVAKD